MAKDPRVGVVMGSDSDLPCMQAAVEVLEEFGVAHEVRVLSAHRTPKAMVNYAESAKARGLQVLIAGAGGAAHLPGMVAALTTLPVIGVPVTSKALNGLDSLYSIVQMPAGIPVATVAIGNANASWHPGGNSCHRERLQCSLVGIANPCSSGSKPRRSAARIQAWLAGDGGSKRSKVATAGLH